MILRRWLARLPGRAPRAPRDGVVPGDWCVATVIPLIGVRVEERGLTRSQAQRRAGIHGRATPMPLHWAEAIDRQIMSRWTFEDIPPEDIRRSVTFQQIAAREMGVDLGGQETWHPAHRPAS